MIYLDNAATSFPKPKSVIKEVNRCITEYCGNPGRSGHRLSMLASEKIFQTREQISSFIGGANYESICFFHNATYALNCIIRGLIRESSHVITSDIEHNSTLRVLKKLESNGLITLSYFSAKENTRCALEGLITDKTRYIVINALSNVTGETIDLSVISEICKSSGISLIVDATQLLGHNRFNINDYEITALCSAGHKGLFGIQGSAFAILKDGVDISPFAFGGSGSDTFNSDMPDYLPDRLEAGTQSTPAIASLCEGIKFIEKVSIDEIEYKTHNLTQLLFDMISSLASITVYGCENGICAFNIDGISSFMTSNLLSDLNIATRGGYHCAPLLHKRLGTEENGAVRISLSYFNTRKDICKLYSALKSIIKNK